MSVFFRFRGKTSYLESIIPQDFHSVKHEKHPCSSVAHLRRGQQLSAAEVALPRHSCYAKSTEKNPQKGANPMNNYVTGAAIRTLREKQHLTQAQLAERISVSDKTVSKWETGRGLLHGRPLRACALLPRGKRRSAFFPPRPRHSLLVLQPPRTFRKARVTFARRKPPDFPIIPRFSVCFYQLLNFLRISSKKLSKNR